MPITPHANGELIVSSFRQIEQGVHHIGNSLIYLIDKESVFGARRGRASL